MRPEDRSELIEAMRARFPTREEMNARFDELRRHFDVVSEHTSAQIRLVAEGVQTLLERSEARRDEPRAELAEQLDPLRAGYGHLQARVERLEGEVFGEPEDPTVRRPDE
ncbi:MAG TPA: hypothetical protein VMT16_12780 [Thermoanaerobaculia bacterium]|nr:hypothetical protein [Thermoanaerobaculia bacterium]